MQMISRAFSDGQEIPMRFTCDGSNVSPPLQWRDVPQGTRSLALIVEDPDAPDPKHPRTIFSHWVVYNIPPDTASLDEAMARLPAGAKRGVNDMHRPAYGGPCPSIGRHRYVHRLFALDTLLPDLGYPTRDALLDAMEGHVLATAELVGTYQRH